MHITILALGSHGDVLPFAVLGKGLRDAGHQVRIVTFENFRGLVEGRGLELFPVQGDAQALMGGVGGLALSESGSNVFRGLKAIMASFGSLTDEYLHVFSDPRLWNTDFVINQLPIFGDDLVEKLGVPYFNASVIPLVRTREFPLPLFPQWKLGRFYNALSYRLAEQLAWQPFRKAINCWRQEVLDLPAKPFLGNFTNRDANAPVLAGFSRYVVSRPTDWKAQISIAGYWLPKKELGWQPPEDLLRFLDAGTPPIFIGFSSMPMKTPKQVTQIIISALQSSGQRGILSTGWGNLGDQDLPETIFKIDYTPYSWLLPRMAGAIIHGGSGSTGAALSASIPTLVVPFVMDQFYWGKRVFELGVGPKPIPFKHLNVTKLSISIDEMTHNSVMQHRAAALGKQIQTEDGVRKAIEIIERQAT